MRKFTFLEKIKKIPAKILCGSKEKLYHGIRIDLSLEKIKKLFFKKAI